LDEIECEKLIQIFFFKQKEGGRKKKGEGGESFSDFLFEYVFFI
jgi:hypothetical protein